MSEYRQPTSSDTDNVDAVRRLRAIARQIEVFFDLQMRKLNEAATHLNEINSENEVALRLAADVEQQKRDWEQDKELESQRLIEAGEKLAQAWQELEEKQREVTPTRRRAPEPQRPTRPPEQIRKQPAAAVAEESETTLFEMKMLQQQVAEHARRHNR